MKGYNRDSIKVSFSEEPTFYINKRKKMITCKLVGVLRGPNETKGWFDLCGGCLDFPEKTIVAVGTAKCHKNDAFDIERGKRIAMSKAENAIYNRASSTVEDVVSKINFLNKVCEDFRAKAFRCQAHNLDYIDSLSMPAHPLYNKNKLSKKEGIETYIK
jgi:hypothetical protein